MNIGFIGTGIMGSSMVSHLLDNGHRVIVNDRHPERAQPLLMRGAMWADKPSELAQASEIIFTMLPTPEDVQEAAVGENGFLQGLPKNALWINTSTVNPSFSREMAALADQQGIRYLEASVAGSKRPMEKSQVILYLGGDPSDVQAALPLLQPMAQAVKHIGGVGAGSAMKLVNNILLGHDMVGLAEALTLGQGMGLSKDTILETLLSVPVAAPFLNAKKDKLKTDDYSVEFPLLWMYKDLHLINQSAYEAGVALPVAAAMEELFGMARHSGYGEKDFSSIYKYMNP